MPQDHDERDGADGNFDDFDDDEAGGARYGPAYWPSEYPQLINARRSGGRHAMRWPLIALVAVFAGVTAFAAAYVATGGMPGSPAASSTPGTGAPGAGGLGGDPSHGGGTLLPRDGGTSAGGSVHLEIGGLVAAVSDASITIGRGARSVTAAVTSATKVTGKVTSIGGVKVGDLVSALVSGTAGKLAASSIQDPASLPSGLGR